MSDKSEREIGGPDPYQTVAQMVPGQTIMGRYGLRKVLGRGGFGVVWLAHDEELEMDIAIKFLTDLIVSNPEAVEDLKRETRFSLKLTHPNIVRIYGFLQGSMVAGISMEYVDGGSLSALKIKQPNRCFKSEDLAPVVEKLCDALHYAHTRVKIAHRDLKPGNLMVSTDGDLKVADFGISRSISDTHTALTRMASATGTPAYMSPEQMMGKPARITDDIYSLGATLYDLLAGKPPFYTGDVAEQVRTRIPPRISERREELGIEEQPVPERWEETIAACLAKAPADRPQDAAEVARKLGFRVAAPAAPTPESLTVQTQGEGEAGVDSSTTPESRLRTPSAPGKSVSTPALGPAPSSSGLLKRVIPIGAILALIIAAVLLLQLRSSDKGDSSPAAGLSGTASPGGEAQAEQVSPSSSGAPSHQSDTRDQTREDPGRDPGEEAAADPVAGSNEVSGEHPDPASRIDPAEAEVLVGEPIAEKKVNPATGETVRVATAGTDESTEVTGNGSGSSEAGAVDPAGNSTPIAQIDAATLRVEAAIAKGSWSAADRDLTTLIALSPTHPKTARYRAQIADGRRVAYLRSTIPSALADSDLDRAQRGIDELASLRPGDAQLRRWNSELTEMRLQATRTETPGNVGESDRERILEILRLYEKALETIDLSLYESLWVSLSSKDRQNLKRAFDSLTRQMLEVNDPRVEVSDAEAHVTFQENRTSHFKAGTHHDSKREIRMTLQKGSDSSWLISSLDAR